MSNIKCLNKVIPCIICLFFPSGILYAQDSIKLSDIEQWRYNYEELKATRSDMINPIVRRDMMEKLDSEIKGYFGKPIEGRAVVTGIGIRQDKIMVGLRLIGPDGIPRNFKGIRGNITNTIEAYVTDQKDPLLRTLNKGDVVDVKGTMGNIRQGQDIMIGWRLNNVTVTLVR